LRQRGMVQITFYEEHAPLSLLREYRRKIEGNRGLSIVRQRTGNQKTLQLLGVPELSKTNSQKPEAVGIRAARIGMNEYASPEVDLNCLKRCLLPWRGLCLPLGFPNQVMNATHDCGSPGGPGLFLSATDP
jgi:hypothetical protein